MTGDQPGRNRRRPEDRPSVIPAVTPILLPVALAYGAAMALGQLVVFVARSVSRVRRGHRHRPL